MRCLKCGFITFDYLKDCPKCKTPADAIIKELFPLQFKPNPPDFTKDYIEALHGLSYAAEPMGQGAEVAQEVELEEISVGDVEAKEDLLPHFQTQEISLGEITLKMDEQPEKPPEPTIALEQEVTAIKEKAPELEVELETLVLEEDKTQALEPSLVLEEDKTQAPEPALSLSLEDEGVKPSTPKILEEPLLVLEEDTDSVTRERELEPDSRFLKIEDLTSSEEEEVKEIQIGLKLEDLDEKGRERGGPKPYGTK